MRMKIISGFAAAALGAALAIGLSTHAQAAAPANYSRACTEIVASIGVVEKAVYGVARRWLAALPVEHTNAITTEPRRSAEHVRRSRNARHRAELCTQSPSTNVRWVVDFVADGVVSLDGPPISARQAG